MPNWCSNSLTLSHKQKEKIDDLESELNIGEDTKLLNYLLPRPTGNDEDWYGWNLKNWGTKWDAQIYDWNRLDENTITISFDSAWSPPTRLYETICSEWDVTAYYYEPGMGFIGKFEEQEDETYEYNITDLDSIESLPEDLIEYGNLREEHQMWVDENDTEETENNVLD